MPDWGGYSPDYLSYDVSSRLALENTYRNHNNVFGSHSGKSGKKHGKHKNKAQNQKNPKAYQYTFSQAVSDEVEQNFIQSLLDHAKSLNALDAAAEQKIRRMQKWNFIPYVRQKINNGKGKDNAAQAMAFWLLINYGTISKAQNKDISTSNLVDQLETSMSKSKSILEMSDADKQRFSEKLLWLSLIQIITQEEAGNDPAKLQAAAEQARKNLRDLGINPDTMSVGKDGLILN